VHAQILRQQLADIIVAKLLTHCLPTLLALFVHIGAADVQLGGDDDENKVAFLDEFQLPPVPEDPIPLEHSRSQNETTPETHCWQCRMKVAVMAYYSAIATKKVVCHGCLETVVDEEERVSYKPHLFVDEQQRLVLQQAFNKLRGQRYTYNHAPGPEVTQLPPEDHAPTFTDEEIRQSLKLMISLEVDSVKCDNDHKLSSKTSKMSRLSKSDWKSSYWTTTVDRIQALITPQTVQHSTLSIAAKEKVLAFLRKVDMVKAIMGKHPDKKHIVEYESGRGVLMMFGGSGTATTLHLDISGALTYQFKVRMS
jgi:hypothetical protein